MQFAAYSRCLSMCLLLGQVSAFIFAPSGKGSASLGRTPAAAAGGGGGGATTGAFASYLPQPRPSPSRVVMQATSNVESSVSLYKRAVGNKRWETDEGIADRAATTFSYMCDVYGEENAVQMVKNSPTCLGYDGTMFQATFEAFSEVFGEEETKGMVTRNPNLLSVRPTGFGGAINAKSDTMQMSYVIAATRPLGPVLLGGLTFCLALPFIEIITGIPREQMLSMVMSVGK